MTWADGGGLEEGLTRDPETEQYGKTFEHLLQILDIKLKFVSLVDLFTSKFGHFAALVVLDHRKNLLVVLVGLKCPLVLPEGHKCTTKTISTRASHSVYLDY